MLSRGGESSDGFATGADIDMNLGTGRAADPSWDRWCQERCGREPNQPLPDSALAGAAPAWRGRWQPRHIWVFVAGLMTVAGVLGSVFAASDVAHNDAGKSQKSFERDSGNIASILQLAIERETDLVVNAGAYAADNPNSSQAAFVQWTNSAQVVQRYPELQGIGVVSIVPAADLTAYAARALADPAGSLTADGSFTLTPPGPRPFYCLTTLSRSTSGAGFTPAGFDSCAGTTGLTLLAARDTGVGTYQPYQLGNETSLRIETPIYAGGSVPGTTAARQAAFVGWVATLINPSVLLARALPGYPDIAVELRYHVGPSDVPFNGGYAPPYSRNFTTALTAGWTVTTSGYVSGSGLFDDRTAVELLISGVGLSVLLGLLIVMLGTGRERARRLVGQRTGQLQYQALHDPLTGLPNRPWSWTASNSCSRAAAGPRRLVRRCFSTWTISRTSTTRSAIKPVTGCLSR